MWKDFLFLSKKYFFASGSVYCSIFLYIFSLPCISYRPFLSNKWRVSLTSKRHCSYAFFRSKKFTDHNFNLLHFAVNYYGDLERWRFGHESLTKWHHLKSDTFFGTRGNSRFEMKVSLFDFKSKVSPFQITIIIDTLTF